MVKGRDAQGYPLEGIDEVPEKSPGQWRSLYSPPALKEVVAESNARETQGNNTLTRLVQLLQAANEREDKLKESVEHWSR